MKKVISIAAILLTMGLGSSNSARAVVILEEDFTGTEGDDITTLGWVNNNDKWPITISNAMIDEGQSAQLPETNVDGPVSYTYDFADVTVENPLPNQAFQLTAALRGNDGIASIYLNGKTRFGQNSSTSPGFEHYDVWHAPDNPGSEQLKFLQVYPYVLETEVLNTIDTTVWVRMHATIGVNGGPDFGTKTLFYSEVSDNGPWTEFATDPDGGLYEVQSITIGQGYGQNLPTWQQPMIDSIKLELVVPEPMTGILMGFGGLVAMLRRRR